MEIRRAEIKDIDQILNLLKHVLKVHADIRPDIFISDGTKYNKEQLFEMIMGEKHLIYVASDGSKIMGYVFCEIKYPAFASTMKPMKLLYIDDLCVDDKYHHQGIGTLLFNFIKEEARKRECDEITLSCWEGNDSAKAFYEKMGLKSKMVTMEYILK